MKHILLITVLFPFLMSCYFGQRSATVQTADQSYLQFNGNTDSVKVIVDENASFVPAESVHPGKFKPQKLYIIQPGKHRVQVIKNETTVIDQVIYIGTNETKEFVIP